MTTVDAVAIVTFDRPGTRNAIDHRTALLVNDMVAAAETDPAIGAIILTGMGDRAFCSGMDLKEAAALGAAAVGIGHVVLPGTGLAGLTSRTFSKPVIAAVNGAAAGGGCEIALCCDIIIAEDHATFVLPEVKRGLYAFAGGIQRMARLMPRSEAMRFILSGEPMPATRLYDLGIVSQIVPRGGALAAAQALCSGLLANSWGAMRASKALFAQSLDLSLDAALQAGVEQGFAVFTSEDAAEGIGAFAEHRSATY